MSSPSLVTYYSGERGRGHLPERIYVTFAEGNVWPEADKGQAGSLPMCAVSQLPSAQNNPYANVACSGLAYCGLLRICHFRRRKGPLHSCIPRGVWYIVAAQKKVHNGKYRSRMCLLWKSSIRILSKPSKVLSLSSSWNQGA